MKITKTSAWIYGVLTILLLLNIWVEHSTVSEDLYGGILSKVDEAHLPISISILIFIGLVVMHIDRIRAKDAEKEKLEEQMNNQMEMIIRANLQLSEYRMRDLLIDLFQRFVTIQPYVLGVQLYEYTISNKAGTGKVRIDYLDGYVRETEELNAAQQVYYSYSLEMMREFQEAVSALTSEGEETDQDDSDHQHEEPSIDPEKLIRFIQKYNHSLSLTLIQDYTEEDAITYSFVSLALYILERTLGTRFSYLDPDKVAALRTKKRTGFLQSILLTDSPYTFSHIGKNEKAGRQYIASPIHAGDRQLLYVIIMPEDILQESEYNDLIWEIADEFEGKLTKTLKMVYTHGKKGDDTHENV